MLQSGKGSDAEASKVSSDVDDTGFQLPPEVIARLRDTVFGFDTFFVTSTENYQADGVLFKGNLRGDPAESFKKMERRLNVRLWVTAANSHTISCFTGYPIHLVGTSSVSEPCPVEVAHVFMPHHVACPLIPN